MSRYSMHTSYTHEGNHPCSCILSEDHHQEELNEMKAESPDLFHNIDPSTIRDVTPPPATPEEW